MLGLLGLGALDRCLNRILAFLCGFGLSGGLARSAFGLACGRFGFQPRLTGLKSLPGVIRALLFLFAVANLSLGGAIVLHQRDLTGTNIRTGAAFNAVEKAVLCQLVLILRAGEPVELLREQRSDRLQRSGRNEYRVLQALAGATH